jgi:hypothetical protein
MKPISLSKIFTEKIFRIPDYQRGYAWQNHTVNKQLTGQLVDFWEDLMNLDPKKTHYTGVLTLEKVPEKIYKVLDRRLVAHKSRRKSTRSILYS